MRIDEQLTRNQSNPAPRADVPTTEAPPPQPTSGPDDPFDDPFDDAVMAMSDSPWVPKIRTAFETLNECVNLSNMPIGQDMQAVSELTQLLRSTRGKAQLRLDRAGLDQYTIFSIIQALSHTSIQTLG
jgi:hypothetical protein